MEIKGCTRHQFLPATLSLQARRSAQSWVPRTVRGSWGATAGGWGGETRRELSARPWGGDGLEERGWRPRASGAGMCPAEDAAPAHSGRAEPSRRPHPAPRPGGSPSPDPVHRGRPSRGPQPRAAPGPAGARGRGAADPADRGGGRGPEGAAALEPPRGRARVAPWARTGPRPCPIPAPEAGSARPPLSGPSAAPGSREADTKGTRVTHLVPRGRGPGAAAPARPRAGLRAPCLGPRSGAGCPRCASAAPPGVALYSRPPSSRGARPAGGEWAAAPSGTKTRGAQARPERPRPAHSAPCRPPAAPRPGPCRPAGKPGARGPPGPHAAKRHTGHVVRRQPEDCPRCRCAGKKRSARQERNG